VGYLHWTKLTEDLVAIELFESRSRVGTPTASYRIGESDVEVVGNTVTLDDLGAADVEVFVDGRGRNLRIAPL
jgi:hypothetical protein